MYVRTLYTGILSSPGRPRFALARRWICFIYACIPDLCVSTDLRGKEQNEVSQEETEPFYT